MNIDFWPKNPKANFGRLYSLIKQGVIKMKPRFWPNFPKAKFLRNPACACFVTTKGYDTDLDFWPKIPKAKTNPISETIKNELNFLINKGLPITSNQLPMAKQTQSNPISNLIYAGYKFLITAIF